MNSEYNHETAEYIRLWEATQKKTDPDPQPKEKGPSKKKKMGCACGKMSCESFDSWLEQNDPNLAEWIKEQK